MFRAGYGEPKPLFSSRVRRHYYIRVYKEADKLRLEALDEPIPEWQQRVRTCKLCTWDSARTFHFFLDGVRLDYERLADIVFRISDGMGWLQP